MTPEKKKQIILETIRENPGLNGYQVVRIAGLPVWTAQGFLPQLQRRGLIRCETLSDRSRTRFWYAV